MKRICSYLLACMTLFSCNAGKHNSGLSDRKVANLKKEALAFSFELVTTYFSKDCDQYYAMISDSVMIMDGDGIIAKSTVKDRMCKGIGRAIRDKTKTMSDYQNAYLTRILTPAEVEAEFNMSLPDYYTTTPYDFFFVGFKLKPDTQVTNFIWDDLFVFMVRKAKGKWLMKGVGG